MCGRGVAYACVVAYNANMIEQAENLKRWSSQADSLGIDGLVELVARFCQAEGAAGKRLALVLRQNDEGQIGEYALSCLAEIFSQTKMDDFPLLTACEQVWTVRSSGKTSNHLAWRYGLAWIPKDMDERDTMEDALMYLAGCCGQPMSLGEEMLFGEVKDAVLVAAKAGYYKGEEFAQRMANSPECVKRIQEAVSVALEKFELEDAAGSAKNSLKKAGL